MINPWAVPENQEVVSYYDDHEAGHGPSLRALYSYYQYPNTYHCDGSGRPNLSAKKSFRPSAYRNDSSSSHYAYNNNNNTNSGGGSNNSNEEIDSCTMLCAAIVCLLLLFLLALSLSSQYYYSQQQQPLPGGYSPYYNYNGPAIWGTDKPEHGFRSTL